MYYIFEPCTHTFCVVNSIGIEVARHWTTRIHAFSREFVINPHRIERNKHGERVHRTDRCGTGPIIVAAFGQCTSVIASLSHGCS